MLSGAAAILFILAAGLRLESRFRPLDGQTAEAVGVVTEKRHGQLYEAYGTVRTANGEARRIKFTLWNAVADELEAGDSFRCTVRVTYNDPHTSEYRTSVGESRFLFCSTGGRSIAGTSSVSDTGSHCLVASRDEPADDPVSGTL